MVVRTESKGVAARETARKLFPQSKGALNVVSGCDFCDLSLIKNAANQVKEVLGDKPLNIIIHNAGLMSSYNNLTSKQGYELMFQSDVLGPQLLQHFLDPLFLKKDSDLKRIVWVASGAHLLGPKEYGIYWENPTFGGVPVEQRPNANLLYGQAKCGNIFQASAWARRNEKIVSEIGCISVSCYPGNLNSDLQRDWGFLKRNTLGRLFWPAKLGAYTELYGVFYPHLDSRDQGAYICPFGEIHDPREDIKEGLKNGTDIVFWDFVEDTIRPFF